MLIDVAVAIADGAETISDVQALAEQPDLHGQVASTATIWRVLDGIDGDVLNLVRIARAQTRERAFTARGQLTGTELPPARAAGRDLNTRRRRIGQSCPVCEWPLPALYGFRPIVRHAGTAFY